jgi:hypothetical protein
MNQVSLAEDDYWSHKDSWTIEVFWSLATHSEAIQYILILISLFPPFISCFHLELMFVEYFFWFWLYEEGIGSNVDPANFWATTK